MTSTDPTSVFSLKYIAASMFATYASGVVHPLELIKTRFQSISFSIKVTMARLPETIWSQNTLESTTPSK